VSTVATTYQREHLVKSHNMNINSNPAASQPNMKKLSVSKIFAGVIDTGD
jgi:hypothetical protein